MRKKIDFSGQLEADRAAAVCWLIKKDSRHSLGRNPEVFCKCKVQFIVWGRRWLVCSRTVQLFGAIKLEFKQLLHSMVQERKGWGY
jgi:hypothetical protein